MESDRQPLLLLPPLVLYPCFLFDPLLFRILVQLKLDLGLIMTQHPHLKPL